MWLTYDEKYSVLRVLLLCLPVWALALPVRYRRTGRS